MDPSQRIPLAASLAHPFYKKYGISSLELLLKQISSKEDKENNKKINV